MSLGCQSQWRRHTENSKGCECGDCGHPAEAGKGNGRDGRERPENRRNTAGNDGTEKPVIVLRECCTTNAKAATEKEEVIFRIVLDLCREYRAVNFFNNLFVQHDFIAGLQRMWGQSDDCPKLADEASWAFRCLLKILWALENAQVGRTDGCSTSSRSPFQLLQLPPKLRTQIVLCTYVHATDVPSVLPSNPLSFDRARIWWGRLYVGCCMQRVQASVLVSNAPSFAPFALVAQVRGLLHLQRQS